MRSWARKKVKAKLAALAGKLQERPENAVTRDGRGLIRWTPELVGFLRENYRRLSLAELTAAFNARFGTAIPETTIRGTLRNHRISSGRTGRFNPGGTPWNLGKSGYMGANETSFAPGNMPHNKRRLWTERTTVDGYVEISVPERNPHTGAATRFRLKHVWLWEGEHGKVPPGHAVIFKDGDRMNCVLDNLMLVSRSELLSMNLHGYREMPEEVKPSVLALAKIEARAGFRLRPGRKRGEEILEGSL